MNKELKFNFYLIRLKGVQRLCFQVSSKESRLQNLHQGLDAMEQGLRGYRNQLMYQEH